MDKTHILAECRRLAHAVAPELDGRIYVVDHEDLGTFAGAAYSSCLGCCWNASFILSNPGFIPDWDGPRTIVSIQLDDIAAVTSDPLPDCLLVTVHEVAHAVVAPSLRPPSYLLTTNYSAELAEISRERIASTATAPRPRAAEYLDHDAAFTRRAMHAWLRARFKGWNLPLGGLLTEQGTGNESRFLAELAGEAHRMVGLTFAEIDATPADPEFTTAWNQAVEHHSRWATDEAVKETF